METIKDFEEWAKKESQYKAETDRLAEIYASYQKGIKEGHKEELLRIARGMKAENIPIEIIVRITELYTWDITSL